MESKLHNIQPVVTFTSLSKPKRDFAYWQSQTPQFRLATLEQIRQEYHRWRYNAQPGFQRVYTIIKR